MAFTPSEEKRSRACVRDQVEIDDTRLTTLVSKLQYRVPSRKRMEEPT